MVPEGGAGCGNWLGCLEGERLTGSWVGERMELVGAERVGLVAGGGAGCWGWGWLLRVEQG
jgi:hypothetical protein